MSKKDKIDTLSENVVPQPFGTAERARRNLNAKLSNPLAGFSHTELRSQGRTFAELHEMGDESDIRAFELGAVLAQSPERYDNVAGLTNKEKAVLLRIAGHSRGRYQTVVNGAQIFYKHQFGIGDESSRSAWLVGLVNSAPYLCCAFISSWLTVPFNHWFGRRGTIFIACCLSAITCLWQGFVSTWWAMFIARFMLGFGIGPKSATVPIYAAETTPPSIRGALVMQVECHRRSELALYDGLGDVPGSSRLLFCLCLSRVTALAARDLYYMHTLLEAENSMKLGRNKLLELIKVPRNRRAMLASQIVMFMQQANFSPPAALAASLGWGLINWLLSIPAIYTIDTFGRRNLLLLTFPLMSMAMLFTGLSFWIPKSSHHARLACIALGTYLFGVVYSPGEEPVPFTYTAEVYPLYVRSYGMALGTATMWFCNFLLGVTWPSLRAAFTTQGAFAWHASWCFVGWWMILLFMPETKGKTLESWIRSFLCRRGSMLGMGWGKLGISLIGTG
ncbi:hypothetical protein N7530_003012 [Penicillium desertorum]|uniref:Major facilitator superfamily (MFS) profile domain-containing protein n=1 Tax=Penicillium desertorum TaxID=1303715 RepID=A0A9W9X4P2_9EURO|nr:hypothetical protein N7530_003012 [Penicillium desertorum]